MNTPVVPRALSAETIRVPTRIAETVAARIPGAVAWADAVDLPWTQPNAEMCAVMNVPYISPILRDYAFPGTFPPYPHQLTMANDLVSNHRFYNLAEMSTGKTAGCIWAAEYLLSIGAVHKVLIICPMTIMEEGWADALFKIAMQNPSTVLYGSAAQRRKKAASPTKYHIINFDGVETILKELQANNYDLVIIDELRAYANVSTSRWKVLNKLIKPNMRVWGLTGTPRPKTPMDTYGQCKLLTPHTVPSSKYQYRDMVMRQVGMYDWRARPEADIVVTKAMSPGRVVLKRDVQKDMPIITYTFRHVGLTREQAAYYEALRKDSLVEGSDHSITAANAAVRVSKMLQVASGAVYSDAGVALQFDCMPRIRELLSVVDQSLSGTLVFAPYRHTVEMLRPHLEPLGFRVITGDTGANERKEILAGLSNGSVSGILAVPGTMSHGVNAQAASTIVWFSPNNSAEVHQQANSRCDRPGQIHPVSVVCLFGSSAERAVYKSLQEQHGNQETFLTAYNLFLKGD